MFERDEVMTRAGTPFSVFTPYRNAWLARLDGAALRAHPVRERAAALARSSDAGSPSLEVLGFQRTNPRDLRMPTGMGGARTLFDEFMQRIDRYREQRDLPAVRGSSYLSVHLRFGTISIRELARAAHARAGGGAAAWLSELVWREFYFMILHHHPGVVDRAFRAEYGGIRYPGDASYFLAWCQGCAGYPLVDAGMRQLDRTGYMHNRLRMVTASFLVKDLLVDWRHGERHFARKLNDYDLAANNGGWQWAASTGAMHSPGSASSIRKRSPSASTPTAASSARTCPNSPAFRTDTSTHHGGWGRSSSGPPAYGSGRTIPSRWWIMRRRASGPSPCTGARRAERS